MTNEVFVQGVQASQFMQVHGHALVESEEHVAFSENYAWIRDAFRNGKLSVVQDNQNNYVELLVKTGDGDKILHPLEWLVHNTETNTLDVYDGNSSGNKYVVVNKAWLGNSVP